MPDVYAGLFRGLVEDINDPEQRKRYRVRVHRLHRPEVPVEQLPWAEWCVYAGKGFGDVPSFVAGDNVFVMFEGGDRRFPVIVGGWLAYSAGTPDLLSEQTGDYARDQEIWTRADRAGNRVTMDPFKRMIELQSGLVTVRVRGDDGTVEIDADARTIVRAPQVNVEATDVTVEAAKVFAAVSDEASLVCEGTINMRAAGTINIGRYENEVTGALLPKTTEVVDIRADNLIKAQTGGALDVDVAGQADVDVTGNLNVRGLATLTVNITTEVNLHCDGPINVDGEALLIRSTSGLVRLESAQHMEIEVANSATITVGGSASIDVASLCEVTVGGNATIEVTGSAELTTGGNATVSATGVARLTSSSKVELDAPVIEVAASSLLSLEGGGTVRMDGGVILIG